MKIFKFILILTVIAACGSSKKDEEFKYYTKEKAKPSTLERTIEATGEIEAISSIEIKSKASGEILFLGADVGDYVNKGDVLAKIDQRTPINNLNQAQAELELANVRLKNADAQYQRGASLHQKGSISDKAFEEIEEVFASAKSAVVRNQIYIENAKIALEDTQVRSPANGTIISRPVEVGQVISSPTSAVGGGTSLMKMADLSRVRVRAFIDEIDIGKISVGQDVEISVSAYRKTPFKGNVTRIEPQSVIEQNVTMFPVLIDIENVDNLLLIGMNTKVIIDVLNNSVSSAIPTNSLRTRKDLTSAASLLNIEKEKVDLFLSKKVVGENRNKFIVIKEINGKPEFAWVEVGKSDLENVEIINGLKEGESVFVLPSKSLVDYQTNFKKRVRSSFGG